MKILSDINSAFKARKEMQKIKISLWNALMSGTKIVVLCSLAIGLKVSYPYLKKVPGLFQKIESNYKSIEELKQDVVRQSDVEKFATKEDINNLATKEDVQKAVNKTGKDIMENIIFINEHQESNKEIILDFLKKQLEVYKPIGMIPIEPKIYGISPDTIKKKLSI